jgi:class 3 adenylate cyclase
VHAAEATRRGQDFSGVEVHKAARVAALAAGGEILVTADTLADMDAGALAVSDVRTVSVKGIAAPFEIMTVEWRTGSPPPPGQE